MRLSKLLLGILFALIWESQCYGYGSIACAKDDLTGFRCFASSYRQTPEDADSTILSHCSQEGYTTCSVAARIDNNCAAAVYPSAAKYDGFTIGRGATDILAKQQGNSVCEQLFKTSSCQVEIAVCDVRPLPISDPKGELFRKQQAQVQSQPASQPKTKNATDPTDVLFDFIYNPKFWIALILNRTLSSISTGIGLGIGVLIVILIYAKRAAITNFIIHGNLPYTIENRSDDIEVLFKRSQRQNWTGRVLFGLTAQLGMTEQQLLLVRRYRLGRTIAFDSLRRQRQNQLAQLHLALAAKAQSDPKDDKSLSQFLAFLRTIFFCLFWLIRSVFSFLFGFMFLRVTIAKLVRGKLIESFDLTMLMQAKAAIEETTVYLKQYLELAETFDGREEVYEPPA